MNTIGVGELFLKKINKDGFIKYKHILKNIAEPLIIVRDNDSKYDGETFVLFKQESPTLQYGYLNYDWFYEDGGSVCKAFNNPKYFQWFYNSLKREIIWGSHEVILELLTAKINNPQRFPTETDNLFFKLAIDLLKKLPQKNCYGLQYRVDVYLNLSLTNQ